MDRLLIILKKENGPRASSAPALGFIVYEADSGERLQDHWSSGLFVSQCYLSSLKSNALMTYERLCQKTGLCGF